MRIDFPWKIKQEAVSSEKDSSFGASNDGADEQHSDQHMHFSAARMFADRYPEFFADKNNSRSKLESRIVLTSLMIITAGVLMTWNVWDERYFHTDSDIIYYMGLTGGILLLLTLFYSLRKRVRAFRKWGKTTTWYYMHLIVSVLGSVLIILHSSFTLKSMNSTVSMIAMLTVIASGIFGRYIYTRIGYHLHRQLLKIRETENRLVKAMHQYEKGELDMVEKNLSLLTASAINTPKSIHRVPTRFLALRAKAAKCYIEGINDITALLRKRAKLEGWDKLTYNAELSREKRFLREHVNTLVDIGRSHAYERLLVGWRIFHVPLIFILVISGSVHVLAVHLY